jgi:hypothetical protein
VALISSTPVLAAQNSSVYAASSCGGDFTVIGDNGSASGDNCLRLSPDAKTYVETNAPASGSCPQKTVDAAGPQGGLEFQTSSGNKCVYFVNGAVDYGKLNINSTPTPANTGCPATATPGLNINCSGGKNPIIALAEFVINWAINILLLLAVVMVVVSGIQYITSQGNPDGLRAAKTRLTNTVVGLVLLSLMFVILHVILKGF